MPHSGFIIPCIIPMTNPKKPERIILKRRETSARRGVFPSSLNHPDFPTLCAHLRRHNVDFLVIGGWAVIAYGLPRTTLDVDIFIKPTKDNAERLIGALSEIGFGTANEITPEEILGKPVLMFADQIRVDIFTKPWGLPDYDACFERRWEAEFESAKIPFASLGDLIKSKETGREQDKADLVSLRKIAEDRQEH